MSRSSHLALHASNEDHCVMTWTLDLKLTPRRHLIAIQDALGVTRCGVERYPDGSRRVHLGTLEIFTGRRAG